MVLAFCQCLNLKITTTDELPISDEFGKLKSSIRGTNNIDCLEFFKTALGTFKELNVFTAEPCLIQQVKLGKWMIQRCVNCDEFVYAFTSAGEYLLNGNLVRDEKKLLEMESCDKYSMPFKIILRQVDNYGIKENLIGNDARIKQLYLKLQDYIADETANTEREIQQFNERKLAELNYKRESAAKDYALLVNIIKSLTNQQQIVTIDCKNSTNLDSLNIQTTNGSGTISDMTDIADTPPITPDSTPMSVDISPSSTNNLKQQQIPQNNNNSSSITNKIKDLSTKHSNMINQQLTQVTKTFDFDEIFDMDGMSNNAPLTPTEGHGPTPTYLTPHKSGQSVKFADQSDDEIVEKREVGLKIPRTARQNSMNLAKSAPIEIMGPVRAEIDFEDDPDTSIDYYNSIKALAKSVHGDTVFGDLPTRPKFSTQI